MYEICLYFINLKQSNDEIYFASFKKITTVNLEFNEQKCFHILLIFTITFFPIKRIPNKEIKLNFIRLVFHFGKIIYCFVVMKMRKKSCCNK